MARLKESLASESGAPPTASTEASADAAVNGTEDASAAVNGDVAAAPDAVATADADPPAAASGPSLHKSHNASSLECHITRVYYHALNFA